MSAVYEYASELVFNFKLEWLLIQCYSLKPNGFPNVRYLVLLVLFLQPHCVPTVGNESRRLKDWVED
jgi:hypothetical protein